MHPSEKPDFQGPSKPSYVRVIEGCLLLILMTVIVGAGLAVVLSFLPMKK